MNFVFIYFRILISERVIPVVDKYTSYIMNAVCVLKVALVMSGYVHKIFSESCTPKLGMFSFLLKFIEFSTR